jgi:hypothetical protein
MTPKEEHTPRIATIKEEEVVPNIPPPARKPPPQPQSRAPGSSMTSREDEQLRENLKALLDTIKKLEDSSRKKLDVGQVLAAPNAVNRIRGALDQLDVAVKEQDAEVQYSLLEELLDM